MTRRRLDATAYTAAWVCALPIELAAAQEMLDEEHECLPRDALDPNLYTLGRIGSHNVVLACLPAGQMGIGPAAASAVWITSTFKSVRIGLMVGVGGGVPSAEADIRLGDVVISQPSKQHGGVVQYDSGKTGRDGRMTRTGSLNTPPKVLLNAVSQLRANQYRERMNLSARLDVFDRLSCFDRETAGPDVLFESTYNHGGGATCAQCSKERAIPRATRRRGEELMIHYGTIASGNQVMKDGTTRDRLSEELGGVLCFEMEAAGLMNDFPCLVIRGICDYADSHKNKTWQPYAAAAAAACAKEILSLIPAIDTVETVVVGELRKYHAAFSLKDVLAGKLSDQPQNAEAPNHSPQILEGQAESIHALLLALQGQITQLPNQLNYAQHASPPQPMHDSDNGEKTENSQLKESIERLQSVVSQEGSVRNEDAESFIDDLECILHSASHVPRHCTPGSSKRKADALSNISSREMKRLCGIVASSNSIGLNVGAPRPKVDRKKRIIQKRKVREVIIQGYKITIALHERSFANLQESQGQSIVRSDTAESFIKVRVLQCSEAPAVITAYLHQVQGQAGFHSLNPVISVGKTLPDDSMVFRIVKRGDVDELKRLLKARHCTLRDRDTLGTPLLHYAFRQPEMCQFLAENGAGVDEMAYSVPDRTRYCPPLIADYDELIWGREVEPDLLAYRRVLLQAGADPTLPSDECPHAFFDAINEDVDFLRLMLDLGGPFIDLEEKDEHGRTGLLKMASCFAIDHDVTRFRLLLDRGANIHARDDEGKSCLQLYLCNALGGYAVEDEMKVLILLIKRGANPFSTDNLGRSIFDDAYECDHRAYWPYGGYKGDLWDAVLSQCDLQEHMRKPEDRVCHYTSTYTVGHFASLWKGREHLCPYFYELPLLCPSAEPQYHPRGGRVLLDGEEEEDVEGEYYLEEVDSGEEDSSDEAEEEGEYSSEEAEEERDEEIHTEESSNFEQRGGVREEQYESEMDITYSDQARSDVGDFGDFGGSEDNGGIIIGTSSIWG